MPGTDNEPAASSVNPPNSGSFERLFDLSLDLLCEISSEGRFLSFNRSWEKLFGWKAEILKTRPFLEFIHPDDCDLVRRKLDLLNNGSEVAHFEARFAGKRGDDRWLAWTCSGVGRAPGAWCAVARDITERRINDAALMLVAKTTGFRGDDYFSNLVKHLAQALGVRWAMVGSFLGQPPSAVHMLAFWTGEAFGDCFDYDLKGTPCAEVVDSQLCLFPREVQKHFPEDKPLQELGVESYIGFPLLDRSRRPLGLLVVMDDKPMPDDFANRTLLEIFAIRAGLELERLINEERLRAESDFRELIIDSAGQGISVCQMIAESPFIRFTVWNQQMREITGYSVEEINRIGWYQALHPDEASQQRCIDRIRRLHQGEELNTEEWELTRSDGTLRQVLITTRLLDRHSTSPRTLSVVQDITERKAAERKAREIEAILRAAFDNFPFDFWIMDQQGRHVLQNPVSASKWGKLVHTPPEEWPVTQEVRDRWHANNQKALNGEVVLGEVTYEHNGEVNCYYNILAPIWVEGKQQGYFGVNLDISDRRQMEDALRHSEKRFRRLVETARDIIFTLSPDGTVLTLNDALAGSTGWVAAEWLGRHFADALLEEFKSEAYKYFERAMQGEHLPLFELPIKTKRGGVVMLEVTLTPLVENGQVMTLLGIGRDVTDRKRMEGDLRQLQKMESVGQLAAGVAHDFNNILTIVQGNASLLLANLPDPGQANLLEQILDASQRAANLTRQLLAFSRKQVLQKRSVNLNEVTSQMTQMLDRILGEDVVLEFHYDTALPPVKADVSMIEQVIMNFAVNARDAMPRGGLLRISTETVVIDEQETRIRPQASVGRFVCVSVEDNGSGITKENLPLIFEPFFTTKEFGKGTGLGLATVYGIIRQHQGWVEVDSTVGKGTVFRVYLPVAEPEPVVTPAPVVKPVKAKGSETILVVEDDGMVRRMIESLLSMGGFQVISAASGAEAVQVWNGYKAKINLLLTDMVMPGGMNGKELAETLRRERPELRVMISSGYSSELISGAEGLPPKTWFLPKPYTPAELIQKVRTALDE
jgi:PAS domain S-box-containing protein